ncbi:MAG: hypothetical protein AAF714_06670 [Pseudomonadota bacterium]
MTPFSRLPAAHHASATLPTKPSSQEARPKAFHRAAPELQFWGYETGNVLASLAGIGGFAVFSTASDLAQSADGAGGASRLWHVFTNVPELAATLGIILLVLVTFAIRLVLSEKSKARGVGLRADMALMRVSLILAAMTALWGANWMTLAAVSFASGSALIRLTYHAPRFLKYGAGMLMIGGACLICFAASALEPGVVAVCLALNGVYVIAAGAMAYGSAVAMDGPSATGLLDRAVVWTASHVAKPAIFWLPRAVKDAQPLYTSMWARLPWRVALALAVTLTAAPGADALVLASLLWVMGDIAFGAMDRPGKGDR